MIVLLLDAAGVQFTDYYSPLNRERDVRKRTEYILLHTTEGPLKGSLRKVHRYGETHYLVATDGHVYRIINKHRVALHAGRSMWRGRTDLDEKSIAIEVVGYHNKDMTEAQYRALRKILEDLQRIYRVPDERVLTHSMVAYGAPNRWHKRSHRGRKRCGMLFARRKVRERLGLTEQPLFDPDVKAGRLVEADPYLAKVLYGSAREQSDAVSHFEGDQAFVITRGRSAWDIARDKYRSSETRYLFQDGLELRGNEITDWKSVPAGTRVVLSEAQSENEAEGMLVVGKDGGASEIAGDEILAASTIYFMPDGRVRQGSDLTLNEVKRVPLGTRMLVGYVHGGYVTAKRRAYDICGVKWNDSSTFYRYRDGRVVAGNQVGQGSIPPMTMVFFLR